MPEPLTAEVGVLAGVLANPDEGLSLLGVFSGVARDFPDAASLDLPLPDGVFPTEGDCMGDMNEAIRDLGTCTNKRSQWKWMTYMCFEVRKQSLSLCLHRTFE